MIRKTRKPAGARNKLTLLNKQTTRPSSFQQLVDSYPIDITSSTTSPPVPKINVLPLIQLGAIITASIGAEGFSSDGIFNNLFASADFEVLNSLWQSFAASQGNIAMNLSNGNVPFNPMFFVWMIDQLNLPISSMMMLYVLLSSVIRKFPSAAEAYINESTEELRKNLLAERQKKQQQRDEGVSPLSRRYRHENAESWDLLFQSRRRIAEIQFQSTTRMMIKENENFYKIATDEISSFVSSNEEVFGAEQQQGDWRNKMLNIHKKVSSSAVRMRNFGKAACYGTSGGSYDNKKGGIPICDLDINEEGTLSIHKKHSSSSAERMRNFGNAAYYGKRNNNYEKKKQGDIIAPSPKDRLRNFDDESREILTLLQQCRRRLYDSSQSAEIEAVPDIDDDDILKIDEDANISPSTATYLKNLLKKQEISTGW